MNPSISKPATRISNLWKTFDGHLQALKGVNLTVQTGEMVGLIGTSGSGKSTLLRHISGLVASDAHPNSEVSVFGRKVQSAGRIGSDVRKIRAGIGFVFQQFNLVSRMSVLKNVLVGRLAQISNYRSFLSLFTRTEKIAAMWALNRVGLAHQATQRAGTLSGGQQQRRMDYLPGSETHLGLPRLPVHIRQLRSQQSYALGPARRRRDAGACP